MAQETHSGGEILLYQTEDGQTKIEVRLTDEMVWLSQAQIVELFQSSKPNISEHIKHIFAEGELLPDSVVRKFRTTAADGKAYETLYYNLDVIISVGYRVKSHRGSQFRIWATGRLKEYIIKGFALDDDRLKQAGGAHYFEELLARIRDIRSSEKVFYRKVLEIYATSIDYDPGAAETQRFFATVQNKMHHATHGQTAAELIWQRANASRPHMGLTSWAGGRVRKNDVSIAKNYLNADELDTLNRIVTLYLDFAELQAQNRRAMHMKDWIAKLDSFLQISEREILDHAGQVSHEVAIAKAESEFERFRRLHDDEVTMVERQFTESLQTLHQLGKGKIKPLPTVKKGKNDRKGD